MRFAPVAAAVLLPLTASAHHSFSPYRGTETLELQGEVSSVLWRNPHIILELRVESVGGGEEIWLLEGWAATSLRRQGIADGAISVGDSIRVTGPTSRTRDRQLLVRHLNLDGRTIMGGEAVQEELSEEQIAASVVEADGIFRVWSPAPENLGLVSWPDELPLLEQANAAVLRWKYESDEVLRCVPPGMPRAMSLNPRPVEFVDNGDTILLYLEEFDAQRTIHLSNAVPQDTPYSPLGYSVGRWEERSLVVTTTHISYPYFNRDGIPQSREVTVEERFSLSVDDGELGYQITVMDPQTFSEPVTGSKRWVWTPGVERQAYNCAFVE